MQLNKNRTVKKDSDLVSKILIRYLSYWPLFLILIVLGAAAAWGYLRYTTPIYEVYATVLIRDEKKGSADSKVLEELNILEAKKIVENEIEVIQSRKLVNKVVNQLGLYAPIYEKGKFKNVSAYNVSPVTIRVQNPEGIVETDKIFFTLNKKKGIVINNKEYPFNKWVKSPYGVLKFELSKDRSLENENLLFFILRNPKDVASDILANLTTNAASKLSTVVELTLKDAVPKRGEDILNKLIFSYSQSSINEKNKLATNTLAFVETRLLDLERELDSLEGQIQHYRTKKGVVDLGEQGKLFLQNVGSNDRKVADISMQLAVLDKVEQSVNSRDIKSGIMPATLGVNDPVLSQLMQRLYDSKLEYEKLTKTTAENNPIAQSVAREIEQLRPFILNEIRSRRVGLKASKNDLNQTSGKFNAVLQSIPKKERELTEISRQQNIKNSVYSFLLEKREQTALAITSNVADSKIVDVAQASSKPVSPIAPFIYIAFIVVALGIGILLISAKELINKKIMFRSEIESFTTIPVVAETFHLAKNESLLETKSKISPVAEQFRQLRASIGLYGKSINTNKKILITSSISGEGKSYISSNLAASLALAEKKVVLIDLDIRNPKISSLMNVSEKRGVAEFLEGSSKADEIIHATKIPNLYCISAGADMDNAREQILSGKLKELLNYLDSKFDYIIMDSSPIDPVTDAYVYSDYCDITLFVVRHAYTPKSIVQLFDNNNKMGALKNPCIVFNDLPISKGILKGTYGYGYGYNYSYKRKVQKGRSSKNTIHA